MPVPQPPTQALPLLACSLQEGRPQVLEGLQDPPQLEIERVIWAQGPALEYYK